MYHLRDAIFLKCDLILQDKHSKTSVCYIYYYFSWRMGPAAEFGLSTMALHLFFVE